MMNFQNFHRNYGRCHGYNNPYFYGEKFKNLKENFKKKFDGDLEPPKQYLIFDNRNNQWDYLKKNLYGNVDSNGVRQGDQSALNNSNQVRWAASQELWNGYKKGMGEHHEDQQKLALPLLSTLRDKYPGQILDGKKISSHYQEWLKKCSQQVPSIEQQQQDYDIISQLDNENEEEDLITDSVDIDEIEPEYGSIKDIDFKQSHKDMWIKQYKKEFKKKFEQERQNFWKTYNSTREKRRNQRKEKNKKIRELKLLKKQKQQEEEEKKQQQKVISNNLNENNQIVQIPIAIPKTTKSFRAPAKAKSMWGK